MRRATMNIRSYLWYVLSLVGKASYDAVGDLVEQAGFGFFWHIIDLKNIFTTQSKILLFQVKFLEETLIFQSGESIQFRLAIRQ